MPVDYYVQQVQKRKSLPVYIDRFLWQGGIQKCDVVAKFTRNTISVCTAVLRQWSCSEKLLCRLCQSCMHFQLSRTC